MSKIERVSRRSFLRAAGATATLAAAGTMVAGTMMVTPAAAAPIGSDVFVSPGSPLIIASSMHLQHVRLRGGQIVINGGDVITIDRLTNE